MNTFAISGMTCGGCVARAQKVLQTFDPDALVTLVPPQAFINNNDLSRMNQALAQVGSYVLSENPISPKQNTQTAHEPWLTTYTPLLLIFGFITVVTTLEFLRSAGSTSTTWMLDFMAGFFLVFGFFKLLNLRAFARNFKAYDLAAKYIPGYALAYPFIEVFLGIAYLMRWALPLTNAITICVMAIGSFSVLRALQQKRSIECACLGTVFKLPMSTVTLVEDLLMLAMAVAMLMNY